MNKHDSNSLLFDYYRSLYDNAFNAMISFQDLSEKTLERTLKTNFKQFTVQQKDSSQAIIDWVEALKKGRADFKIAVDEGFAMIEKFFPEREWSDQE